MATSTLKTRIKHKIDTASNWASSSLVPLEGELIIYKGDKPQIKVGDGTTAVGSLPFIKAGGDTTITQTITSGTQIASISIDGVATKLYAPSSIAWGNVTGKPSSFTPSTHYHDKLSGWADTRAVATTPNDYNAAFKVVGIKQNATIPIDGSSYSTLIGIRGWSDSSGGNSHELAFTGKGSFYRRHGSTTTWNAWVKILDSNNYTEYVPTKTGTGASGTWGINITGNAATANSVAGWNISAVDTDANTILTAGCYRCNTNMTNIPTGTYGQLLVIFGGGDTIAQIYFSYTGPDIYVRTGNVVNNATGSWTAWRRIWVAGDAVTGAVWN